jgi:hypothetical protein
VPTERHRVDASSAIPFGQAKGQPKAWREMERVTRWWFEGAPVAFRFVYARMGQMVETPSRGTLRAEPTPDNIQRGPASYVDVADALVQLAGDDARTWERKALFFNYE